MTCIRIHNGIICVAGGANVDLKKYGSPVNMEFDKRFGPLFYRRNGDPIDDPTPKMWAAFEAWQKEQR